MLSTVLGVGRTEMEESDRACAHMGVRSGGDIERQRSEHGAVSVELRRYGRLWQQVREGVQFCVWVKRDRRNRPRRTLLKECQELTDSRKKAGELGRNLDISGRPGSRTFKDSSEQKQVDQNP